MATALAAQLAQIRDQSTTNSLDLKAQRKAHSQSLIFESSVATSQDFDTIYQICSEGFEDLCRLDLRFASYSNSIFSEQSKNEDRTQMTKAQNEQLDVALEGFLGLVSGKLMLKPAIKAVEWLVRRFRYDSPATCPLCTMNILRIAYRGKDLLSNNLLNALIISNTMWFLESMRTILYALC